jgi:hypothetical protein
MSKKSKQTVTNVTKSGPWAGAEPNLMEGLTALGEWYSGNADRQPYPGSTVVPFSPFTQAAMDRTVERATAGSPLIRSAQNMLQSTVQGDYLNPMSNLGLRMTNEQAGSAVQDRLAGQYPGMSAAARADRQKDLETTINAAAYVPEQTRQMQAMLFAPQMANQDYADAAQLANVGQRRQAQEQAYINDSMNRYNFQQQQPYNRLQQYLQPVQGIATAFPTSKSTGSSTSPNNWVSEALGTAASVAAIAAFF